MENFKLAVIGAGAMGGALVRGLLDKKILEPSQVAVANPHLDKISDLRTKGVFTSDSNTLVVKNAENIVIAVKPWKLNEVITEVAPHIPDQAEVSVIVAGISGEDIIDMWGDSTPTSLSIAMPNTAMSVGESMTFLTPLLGVATNAISLFEAVGKVKVIEERLLPGAMALASCGIAYALRYVRAAQEGGVQLGFKANEACNIICQTLSGAVALLNTTGSHPESEIDKVTTPGGLTIKGLYAMEKSGFSSAVIDGLLASVK